MNKFEKTMDDFPTWRDYFCAKKAHYQKELPQFTRKLSREECDKLNENERTEYFTWENYVLYAKCKQ